MSTNNRYGLDLQINRKNSHTIICILLAGDIAINPGPFNLRPTKNEKGLSFCHWNIQRLMDSKFEEIVLSLRSKHESTFQLDVLILTETFSNENIPDSYYKIPEYVMYRKDRKGKVGGGIIMYVNKTVEAKRRMDLESNDTKSIY